ncbi:MAG: MmcQ/YjbR family DNA-binding protein [Lactobacillales bacterium]|jgi:predicted DNA-binding protein (MmcQ/YjbR family)|nr:MmcQ/YjbR family DNA-binding protein [Lactobacillales bacterium]
MTTKNELFEHIKKNFGIIPDYPFKEDIAIFRHTNSRKWFAAVMLQLDREKLGLKGTKKCDVVNLKCHPALSGTYRMMPGILPGYHINKEHWVTVLLDGTVDPETLNDLVKMSYDLTASKSRKKR